jgi:hypothetical protein
MPELESVKSLRLSDRLLRAARHRSRIEHVDESTALRHIIALGAEEYAATLYRDGKVTLREAAELAGLTLWEMMDRLEEKGIRGNLSAEQERESIRTALDIAARDAGRKSAESPWVAMDRGGDAYRRSARRKKKTRRG